MSVDETIEDLSEISETNRRLDQAATQSLQQVAAPNETGPGVANGTADAEKDVFFDAVDPEQDENGIWYDSIKCRAAIF